jgi:hypothetical protein
VYSVAILGNVEQCRTEAEISDGDGAVLAVVYETSDGWRTDILVKHLNQATDDFQTAIENAKETLSHYVNRRGENPPENATRGAFSDLRRWTAVSDVHLFWAYEAPKELNIPHWSGGWMLIPKTKMSTRRKRVNRKVEIGPKTYLDGYPSEN